MSDNNNEEEMSDEHKQFLDGIADKIAGGMLSSASERIVAKAVKEGSDAAGLRTTTDISKDMSLFYEEIMDHEDLQAGAMVMLGSVFSEVQQTIADCTCDESNRGKMGIVIGLVDPTGSDNIGAIALHALALTSALLSAKSFAFNLIRKAISTAEEAEKAHAQWPGHGPSWRSISELRRSIVMMIELMGKSGLAPTTEAMRQMRVNEGLDRLADYVVNARPMQEEIERGERK